MFIGSRCNVAGAARRSMRMWWLRDIQSNRFVAPFAIAHQCISRIIGEFIDCAQFAWSDYDGLWTVVGTATVKSNGNGISHRIQCQWIFSYRFSVLIVLTSKPTIMGLFSIQEMRQNVQEFATSLLDQTRTSHELEVNHTISCSYVGCESDN